MQSDNNQVYRLTAERTDKPQQFYKDIGNFVFAQLYAMQREPNSLIIKLKGVGSWHLRKKRMEIIVNEFPERNKERTRADYSNDVDYQKYLDKKRVYNLFIERLKDYEEYLSLKRKVNEERRKTQVLLSPVDKTDIRFKSS